MEAISVFDFTDYRRYLHRYIDSRPKKGRGVRSALAQAAGCQVAYLTRVFSDQAELSLEQADAIAQYLGFSQEEANYFLLMIQYARAGTPRLRGHFANQLEEVQKKRLILKERFKVKETLTLEAQTKYYSSWIYTAIHMCITVPGLQTRDAIARYLKLSPLKVGRALEFLESVGLARTESGRTLIGNARVHLGADSELISKHHTNWRIQAIASYDREGERDLHYTSIVSLSRADQHKLKALLVKTIEEFNATVAPSPEEEVHCLAMDFFGVKSASD